MNTEVRGPTYATRKQRGRAPWMSFSASWQEEVKQIKIRRSTSYRSSRYSCAGGSTQDGRALIV